MAAPSNSPVWPASRSPDQASTAKWRIRRRSRAGCSPAFSAWRARSRASSASAVARLNKQGRWAVGDNVYLQVSEWGTKAWIFRYERDGRARHMGLGPYSLLTLAEARARGREQRRLLLDGIDPLEAKRRAKRERLLTTIRHRTFEQVARDYIAAHEDNWRGD